METSINSCAISVWNKDRQKFCKLTGDFPNIEAAKAHYQRILKYWIKNRQLYITARGRSNTKEVLEKL